MNNAGSCSCHCSSDVFKELKNKGELRISSFTEDRISSLKEQVLSAYKSGVGIKGSKFSEILFGYQQALNMYEGIAYHFFGLVATRKPNKKKGPLYLVSIAEVGNTAYPVIPSSYHNYDKTTAVRNVIESAWADTNSSSKSNLSSKETNEILALLFSDLSTTCSKIAEALK